MKIVSKIDCLKKKYPSSIIYPVLDKEYPYIIADESEYSCKVLDEEEEGVSDAIDCFGIDCSDCFFSQGKIEDIREYINLLP